MSHNQIRALLSLGYVDADLLRDVPLKKIFDDDQFFVGFAGLHSLLKIPHQLNDEISLSAFEEGPFDLYEYVFEYIEQKLLSAPIGEGGLSYEEMLNLRLFIVVTNRKWTFEGSDSGKAFADLQNTHKYLVARFLAKKEPR